MRRLADRMCPSGARVGALPMNQMVIGQLPRRAQIELRQTA